MQIGDRMKLYESLTDVRLTPGLPVLARMDGRAFHTFTRGLTRPFDERFHNCMVETTKILVKDTNALVGYTQSDEITLVWPEQVPDEDNRTEMFGGRVQKLASTLASQTAVVFLDWFRAQVPDHKTRNLPTFDARVWVAPSRDEACNALLWRELDATRCSILAVSQHEFGHKAILGLDLKQLQEKLFQEKGINWSKAYPTWAKRGTWVRKDKVVRAFTAEELAKLPEQHEARKKPELQVERTVVRVVEGMPRFASMWNRIGFVFDGDIPSDLTNKDDNQDSEVG